MQIFQMAEAGSVGNVDEAQEMMKQVETMRQERETLKATRTEDPQKKVFLVSDPELSRNFHVTQISSLKFAFTCINNMTSLPQVKQNVPFINEMKHMEVCPVCGAFLVVNDTQTRVDAHLSGKQHVGYALIRDAIKELKVSFYLFLFGVYGGCIFDFNTETFKFKSHIHAGRFEC